MKADQLTPDRAPWKTAGYLVSNGAATSRAADEQGADAATAAQRAAWQQVIAKLTEWARNPSELEDDRLDPPSAEMTQRAINFARALLQAGYPAPTNVVPDANGGIVFHRREKDSDEEFHFWDDGTVEYFRFHGTRLVERKPL